MEEKIKVIYRYCGFIPAPEPDEEPDCKFENAIEPQVKTELDEDVTKLKDGEFFF